MDSKKIWKKVFETKHDRCIFDVETSTGRKHQNIDYSKVLIGTRKLDPKEEKIMKMTFHCHNCTSSACSSHGKPDYSISEKDHGMRHVPEMHKPVS